LSARKLMVKSALTKNILYDNRAMRLILLAASQQLIREPIRESVPRLLRKA